MVHDSNKCKIKQIQWSDFLVSDIACDYSEEEDYREEKLLHDEYDKTPDTDDYSVCFDIFLWMELSVNILVSGNVWKQQNKTEYDQINCLTRQ